MNFNDKSLVFILTDETHSKMEIGFTNKWQKKFKNKHKSKTGKNSECFSKRKLVYYEVFDEISSAMTRERAIQEWEIPRKINLVNNINPEWEDLTPEIMR